MSLPNSLGEYVFDIHTFSHISICLPTLFTPSPWLNASGQHTFVACHRCIYLFVNDHIKERRHIRLQGFAHPIWQFPRIGDPVTMSAKCACHHTIVNVNEIVHIGNDVVIMIVLLLMVLERQGTIIQDYDEDRDMTPQCCFEFAQMIPEPPISYYARNVMAWRTQSRAQRSRERPAQ